jgi:cytochrome b561
MAKLMENSGENSGPPRFDGLLIALHWTIVGLMAVVLACAWIRGFLGEDGGRDAVVQIHIWVGLTIFALAWVRLGRRLTTTAPPMPATMPAPQRRAASIAHVFLYVIMLVMPLTGYIALAARAREPSLFGILTIDVGIPHDRLLARSVRGYHDLGQYVVYGVIGMHIAAALYHRFVVRDDIFNRMWPGRAGMATVRAREPETV